MHTASRSAHRVGLAALVLLACGLSAAAQAGADVCARISVFDSAPRSQKLYRAVLIAVDGSLPGPASATSYRIAPGPHTLTVAEAIDPQQFIGAQHRERDGRRGDRYKTLQIEAQPGITYRLAAKFHLAQRNRIRDGAYWDPVIWKQSAEPCR